MLFMLFSTERCKLFIRVDEFYRSACNSRQYNIPPDLKPGRTSTRKLVCGAVNYSCRQFLLFIPKVGDYR